MNSENEEEMSLPEEGKKRAKGKNQCKAIRRAKRYIPDSPTSDSEPLTMKSKRCIPDSPIVEVKIQKEECSTDIICPCGAQYNVKQKNEESGEAVMEVSCSCGANYVIKYAGDTFSLSL